MTKTGRRTPYSPALDVMIDNFDGHDPWGSAMSMGFALCEVAYSAGVYGVASILDYSPGMSEIPTLDEMAYGLDEDSDVSFEAVCLAGAYLAGQVDDDDLIRAAKVLSRYIDLCKRAGRNY